MTIPKPDPRDAILAWLEQHAAENPAWVEAALNSVLLPHRLSLPDPKDVAAGWVITSTFCVECTQPWPCKTIRTVADALGVAT